MAVMLPPATIEEGVLGLEGQHLWGGSSGFQLGYEQIVVPRIRLTDITGIHSKPIQEDSKTDNMGRMGQSFYDALLRGKTVVYSGEIKATSLPELRVLQNQMRGLFFPSTVRQMYVRPHPDRGGVAHFYTGRCIQCDVDDRQVNGPYDPWARLFIIGIEQDDPRYYADSIQAAGSLSPGVTHSMGNAGNAPTEPAFTVPGPFDQVDIRNQTMDKKLLLTGMTGLVPSGQSLRVDFSKREIYNLNTGVDLSGRLDPTFSDWWDEGELGLLPGNNDLWVGGTGTTSWAVAFYPANF